MRQKTWKMRLKPTNHLKLVDKKQRLWSVTGDDPQFHVKNTFGYRLLSGIYEISAIGGRDLDRLTQAVLYVDTGAGFSESEKLPIEFRPDAGNGLATAERAATIRFDRPVRAIRLDPSAGEARPIFALKGLSFTRIDCALSSSTKSKRDIADTRPKVLLNLVRLLPDNAGAGGAGRLCLALLRYLPERVRLRAAISPHNARLAMIYPLVEFVIVPADDNAHLNAHLEWCDAYVDPLNALRPTMIDSKVAVIAMVLDLQNLRMPWFFSRQELDARIAEYGYAIGRSDRLIAISDYERENLESFYGAAEVSVVHLSGFMAEEKRLTQEKIEHRRKAAEGSRSYLIYPAVPWPHKNHEILIQAVAIMRRRSVDVPLVLTNIHGNVGLGERLPKLSASLGVADLVTCEPFLPEDALMECYLQASGMVFPSLYEGFGIPLVDAMMLGVPLLVNDTSATLEICGGACETFTNARNALAVANDIARFWRDEDGRKRLSKAGFVQGEKFSSRKMAAEFSAVIVEAIKRKNMGGENASHVLRAPPKYSGLSVFVAYIGLSDAERKTLRSIDDIDNFHASVFGADACVTVGFDIRLVEDEAITKIFEKAGRLICLDGAKADAPDFCVQEFSSRYDEGEYQLVTRYPDCADRYRPDKIRAMTLALTLFPNACYATLSPDVDDCVADAAPNDIDGALAYDTRRKTGCTVWDALIRRGAVSRATNGTVSFLSYFATRCRRVRVPNKD